MSYRCSLCHKGRLIISQQRHHKGVAGGKWKHRAPKTLKISLPNLHRFKGKLYCTKCLRRVKETLSKDSLPKIASS